MKFFLLFSFFTLMFNAPHAQTSELLKLKEKNHFAMIRHTLAPGLGDPLGFRLDLCQTQRNLSDQGRRQARKMGTAIRKVLGSKVDVHTSQWCRCKDTAKEMAFPYRELPILNSFFAEPASEARQMKELKEWLTSQLKERSAPLFLITHQVNITALTGAFPQSGEILIVKMKEDGTFEVVGKMNSF